MTKKYTLEELETLELSTPDLSWNNISNEGAKALAKNTHITSLDVSYNNINDEGTQKLCEIINKNLISLNMGGNEMNVQGIKNLMDNPYLTSLYIDNKYNDINHLDENISTNKIFSHIMQKIMFKFFWQFD